MGQSVRCDRIVVVDNASTDSTARVLSHARYQDVQVCRLHKNTGASGGFSLGFQLGYATGADFVWVMDDDVIPDEDALQKLLDARSCLEDQSVYPPYIVSTARTPAGDLTNTPGVARGRNVLNYPDWPRFLEHGLVPTAQATFVSILISRNVIGDNGFPIADMFIWGEDTEYTRRISKAQPGFLCANSKVQHVRAQPGNLSLFTETNPDRFAWHAFKIRNRIYTVKRFRSRGALFQLLFRLSKQIIRCLFKGDWTRTRVLWRGLFDGIRFNPRVPSSSDSIAWNNIAYISPPLERAITGERDLNMAEQNHQPGAANQDSLTGKGPHENIDYGQYGLCRSSSGAVTARKASGRDD